MSAPVPPKKNRHLKQPHAPGGRRAFFRGVAAAVGINAFKEAEGRHGEEGWGYYARESITGHHLGAGYHPGCDPGHHTFERHYPAEWGGPDANKTRYYCHHKLFIIKRDQNGIERAVCKNGSKVLISAGNSYPKPHSCLFQTIRNPKGISVRTKECSDHGNTAADNYNMENDQGAYLCGTIDRN